MNIKVVFPKENHKEAKQKDIDLFGDESHSQTQIKTKLQLEIEAKIQKMLLEPRLYDEFLQEFALKRKQMALERAFGNANPNTYKDLNIV